MAAVEVEVFLVTYIHKPLQGAKLLLSMFLNSQELIHLSEPNQVILNTPTYTYVYEILIFQSVR